MNLRFLFAISNHILDFQCSREDIGFHVQDEFWDVFLKYLYILNKI